MKIIIIELATTIMEDIYFYLINGYIPKKEGN